MLKRDRVTKHLTWFFSPCYPPETNAMTTKRNVVLYLDEEIVEKSRALGFNLSRTFENHLKQLINHLSNQQCTQNHFPSENRTMMVGLPGFEPGSIAPEATSLDQTSRQPRCSSKESVSALLCLGTLKISFPRLPY